MAIKEFNKSNVKTLRTEIDAAMQKIAEKHGLEISLGNLSFNSSKINASKMSIRAIGAVSQADLMYSKQCGFKGNAYGETFIHEGETFTIKGLKPKNKRQIIADGNQGNSYVFPKQMVFKARPELKA